MKKVFILGLGVALVAGGMSSCGKTSKGKMANEWAVAGYDSESETTYEDLSKSTSTVSLNGTVLTRTNVNTPNGSAASTSTSTKTVNNWTYTIVKDGSWSSLEDVTETYIDSVYDFFGDFVEANTVVNNTVNEVSGVWNFVGTSKAEEFKKNERLMFSALTSKSTVMYTYGTNATQTSINNSTYTAGNDAIVYTVVESSKKELQLKSDSDYTSTDQDGVFTSNFVSTLSLSQK